jgi:hypothetical protein
MTTIRGFFARVRAFIDYLLTPLVFGTAMYSAYLLLFALVDYALGTAPIGLCCAGFGLLAGGLMRTQIAVERLERRKTTAELTIRVNVHTKEDWALVRKADLLDLAAKAHERGVEGIVVESINGEPAGVDVFVEALKG